MVKSGTVEQRRRAAEYASNHGITEMPNFSSAVSAQRHVHKDKLDDFPTVPWGGRAWVEHVAGIEAVRGKLLWEPAANRGYLHAALSEYAGVVIGSDIMDYGAGFPLFDFLTLKDSLGGGLPDFIERDPDWIVTNPPFSELLNFCELGLKHSKIGTAMFCRVQAQEGETRYTRLFEGRGLNWMFSTFSERCSLVRGTVDPDAHRPACHGWLTLTHEPMTPEFIVKRRIIPPCRKRLERPDDYRARGRDRHEPAQIFATASD